MMIASEFCDLSRDEDKEFFTSENHSLLADSVTVSGVEVCLVHSTFSCLERLRSEMQF